MSSHQYKISEEALSEELSKRIGEDLRKLTSLDVEVVRVEPDSCTINIHGWIGTMKVIEVKEYLLYPSQTITLKFDNKEKNGA